MDLLRIANLALDLLGQKHIIALNGKDRVSSLVTSVAELQYRQALRTYKPRFATVKGIALYELSTETYALPPDYEMIVDFPGDFIMSRGMIEVVDNDYRVKLGENVEIEYLSNDVQLLVYASAQFCNALAYSMAAQMAFPLTHEGTMAQTLSADADKLWLKYSYSNNLERRPSRFAQDMKHSNWRRR